MNVRTEFQKELEQLHLHLIRMGGLVEEAIDRSIQAFEKHDSDLAQSVVDNDKQIDDLEREIETQCLRLLLRQQPVAKDLRAISTALKIVTDMERIGDHAVGIADILLRFGEHPRTQTIEHIPLMAHIASSMVKDSVNAFVHSDMKVSREVIERDDEVDHLFHTIQQEIISLLVQSPENADEAIDLLLITKYIERIGDHAENIAQWVIFYVTGSLKDKQII
ncbi:phosphate signaling complex protein PhoU [Ethanoligenens harbinense]|uniref:Phosphate-specific transport system accessory protein PhoU n=1 Tax=Ethanoligenens harbinense (strain DSM 18485 / JCM 12961 / CGMCC 1.5033 / YUAN-3) TaxID=663278 RepID=E6U7A0_ETHHY|nr:phosphate signaling complex protein PhoU [Ethanoligenens harbinense]ADU25835.1 phosphate uptake regulator, PhoU [Ethanoligenens harbinense YUAN-3]